jgi:hypothetical protein
MRGIDTFSIFQDMIDGKRTTLPITWWKNIIQVKVLTKNMEVNK